MRRWIEVYVTSEKGPNEYKGWFKYFEGGSMLPWEDELQEEEARDDG